MAIVVPATIRASPLPVNFKGTPQQFLDAIVARLSIESSLNAISFVSGGGVAPTSNVGPWLKNGTTWYVWSDAFGTYVPEIIEFQSLRYIASQTEPDPNVYTLWVILDANGKAQGIAYYSGGQWKSVYDDSFLSVIGQINEVKAAQNQYPFRGDSAGDQNMDAPVAEVNVIFNETFDPSNVFDNSQFIAPVDGYYQLNAKVNMELGSGTPTDNSIIVSLTRNGLGLPNDSVFGPIDNDSLGSRTYLISTIVQLLAGDRVRLLVQMSATGTATWVIKGNNTYISGSKILTG